MSHFVISSNHPVGSETKSAWKLTKNTFNGIFIHPERRSRRLQIEPKEDIPIKRTSITLEDPVYEAGQQIAAKRGFGQSFSAYIAWLIQRDAEGGVTREEAPLHNIAKASGKKAKPAKRQAKRGK